MDDETEPTPPHSPSPLHPSNYPSPAKVTFILIDPTGVWAEVPHDPACMIPATTSSEPFVAHGETFPEHVRDWVITSPIHAIRTPTGQEVYVIYHHHAGPLLPEPYLKAQ